MHIQANEYLEVSVMMEHQTVTDDKGGSLPQQMSSLPI
jgi:hypothetical protein